MADALGRGRDDRALSVWDTCQVRMHEKAAICKPGREVSPGNDSADTLILDFWSSELWDNEFLLFKQPSLWYCVMAAQAD